MTDNEQTPTSGGGENPPPAQPPANEAQPPPGSDPAQGPQQPGQSARRRRRRRGRRGRGGQGQPGAPGPVGNGQGASPAPGAAAAPAAAPQPQGQPEVLEEVEGVLDYEGKGQGWLRDSRRSYVPQAFDVEVPRWLIDRTHLQPGHLVKGQAAVRGMKRVLQKVEQLEGTDPLAVVRRTAFTNLTATDPSE